jgi:hypothetical protein
MITTPFLVGDKEYSLRYENKQQQDIKHNAPKRFDLKGKFASPMAILDFLGDTDVMDYLLAKGLEWEGSGIEKVTTEKAAELRQEFLETGEADAGEKYESLQMILADALSLNVIGASAKKLKEKGEAAQEEKKKVQVEELAVIYEAQMLAKERYEAKKLLNTQPSVSSE